VRYDALRYPSDLSDERWEPIRPVIDVWKAAHPSVRASEPVAMREIVNAIL
jgi:transposase